MRTVLILNPTSGISTVTEKHMSVEDTEKAILQGLQASGIEPEVSYTTPEDTGKGLATRAAAEHIELVIAVGGDGTIHAVANGLVGTQSTLGIIPTGTMNNLAHSLNIPDAVPAACVAIATGETRLIDVGKMNEQVFLEVAGVGLEAALFPAAEEMKKPGLLTTLRGVVSGLKTLLTFKPTRIRITFDNRQRRPYEALQVTICNAPFYGMHLEVVPNILMDDGLLDVVSTEILVSSNTFGTLFPSVRGDAGMSQRSSTSAFIPFVSIATNLWISRLMAFLKARLQRKLRFYLAPYVCVYLI
jgi:diacylglycerol kinase (ATP)